MLIDRIKNNILFAPDDALAGGSGLPVGSDAGAPPTASEPPVAPPSDGKGDPQPKTQDRKITSSSVLDGDIEDVPDDQPAEAEPAKEGDEPAAETVFKSEELTLPEGMTMDQVAMDRFSPILNELGLPASKAQPLVDAYIEVRKQEQQAFEDIQVDWKKTAMADPEIGKGQWKDTVMMARKAVDAYGSPEFRELLAMSGISNHPETLRFLRQAGATVLNDRPVRNEVAAAPKRDAVDILYPNQKG